MKFSEFGPEHRLIFPALLNDVRANDPKTYAAWLSPLPDDFDLLLALRQNERRDWRPKAKQISTTWYLLYDDDGAAGLGVLRFPLDQTVEASGGNAWCVITPGRRGRGLGTLLLNRTLGEAARAGLARARVSCPADDPLARHVIERNGGVIDDLTPARASYWIRLR